MDGIKQLEQVLEDLEYGTFAIAGMKYEGAIGWMIVPTEKHIKPEDNAMGGARVLQLLADTAKENFNGEQNFSVEWKNGKIKLIKVINQEKQIYGNKSK